MTRPVPSTLAATLWSSGSNRPTEHRYERSRDIRDSSGKVIAVEHMYRCQVSGAVRRWGLDELEVGDANA